jgi:hypothetical protein
MGSALLAEALGPALLIWVAVVPCIAAAQSVQVLPAPGTQVPLDTTMKRAYTIQRGMPYSGVRVVHNVVVFPNGERQENGARTKEWRDSEGRTRKDDTWTSRINGVVTVCQIDDPVALVRYIWRIETAQKTVVTETHYKMDGVVTEVWPDPPDHEIEPQPGRKIVILVPQHQDLDTNMSGETLGPEYINGVYATGTRSVTIISPGKGGNGADHPAHRIDEIWTAPDLNMVVKMFLDDGLGFTELDELKDIDRSEPDMSVFLPPEGLPKRVAPESDPVWSEPIGDVW